MGLIDSVRDRLSSGVSQVKETVSEVVTKVEEKVEQKAESLGHAAQSVFEPRPSAPPPAPPPPSAPSTRGVSGGAAGLRNALNASIADAVRPPPPSSDTQAAAKAILDKHSSWKGLDEEAVARDMSDLVQKDPTAAAPVIREVMSQLSRSDRDDVAEEFAKNLSPDQLRTFAQHPDGKQALETMQYELRTGYTTGHEAEMATRLGTAVSEAGSRPLPHTVVDMPPGGRGVNAGDEKKTPSGRIPAEDWADPSKLVGALTQNPASGSAAGNTCLPSTMLASTLMASPEKAARFLENVAKNDEVKTLTMPERNDLVAIADRVRNKTATFEDLGKAQQLLFRAGNTEGDMKTLAGVIKARGMTADGHLRNVGAVEEKEFRDLMATNVPWTDPQAKRVEELFNRITGSSMHMAKDASGTWAPKIEGDLVTTDDSGFSENEANRLAKLGGLTGPSSVPSDVVFSKLPSQLQPGEAISVRVAGDPNGNQSNHFITIGRRDDGTLYLYNPDPAKGDATLTVGGKGAGTEEFKALLATYSARQMPDPNSSFPPAVPYRLN